MQYKFMQYLNQSHPTIKFTHESSTHSVDFLDLTIYKGQRHATSRILDIKPFFKPTNKFQYLEYSSAHPRGIFTSLAKGEFTRLLRACSDEETYNKVSDKLLKALKERRYPNHLLQKPSDKFLFKTEPDSSKVKRKTDKHMTLSSKSATPQI